MTVLLIGDSHLAFLYGEHPDLVARHLGDDVECRAFGGAVATDLAGQVRGLALGSFETVVLSIGTNDAFQRVPLSAFAETLAAVLSLPARWVGLPSPGADEQRPEAVPLARAAAGYGDACSQAVAAVGGAVVPTRQMLAPLGSVAFTGDGVHLTREAYELLVPAIAVAGRAVRPA